MHANLVRWRLHSSVRDPEAYDQFLRTVSLQNIPILRRYGLLDSFALRTSDDTVTFLNLFETEDEADAAWQAVRGQLSLALEGKVGLIERLSVRADDLPRFPEGNHHSERADRDTG
jgi:hypothetical protein